MTFCSGLFVKEKTAYEMRISDWSSDVCSSDLLLRRLGDLESREFRTTSDVEDRRLQLYHLAGSRPGNRLKIGKSIFKFDDKARAIPERIENTVSGRSSSAIHAGASERRSRSEEHTSALQSLMRNTYAVS